MRVFFILILDQGSPKPFLYLQKLKQLTFELIHQSEMGMLQKQPAFANCFTCLF